MPSRDDFDTLGSSFAPPGARRGHASPCRRHARASQRRSRRSGVRRAGAISNRVRRSLAGHTATLDGSDDLVGIGSPDEGFGIMIGLRDEAVDGGLNVIRSRFSAASLSISALTL